MSPTRGAQLAAGVSVLGLAISGYLGALHLALVRGELLGGPLCGAAGSIFNCHAVAMSQVGQGFGLPLAFWGVLGYLVTVTLSVIAWQCPDEAPRSLTVLAGVAVAYVALDAALLWVMVRQLRVLCLLCVATYGVNIALALTARSAAGRSWRQLAREFPAAARAFVPRPRAAVAWALWGVVLTGGIGVSAVWVTGRLLGQPSPAMQAQIRQHLQQTPRVVVDTAGAPRLGSAAAPVQIVSFVDFFCPLCRETARYNAIIAAAHPGQVSLVVKMFPLDQACNTAIARTVHPGACQLAAAAHCAQAQGKFWALHDRLFARGPAYLMADLESDARRAGLDLDAFRQCLAAGDGAAAVARDVADAARLQITSTPISVINGVLIQGTVTPAQFEELVRALRDVGAAPAPVS
ncbi:MAG: thioredoxin domain-containing protein [Candidatus Omnitrophica bacterium]|nr:thioredoxin domain-containing protein [Candidatus Omnitrophota bacterium]